MLVKAPAKFLRPQLFVMAFSFRLSSPRRRGSINQQTLCCNMDPRLRGDDKRRLECIALTFISYC